MNQLKLVRMQAGMTQLQLARRVDVSEQKITKIETGRMIPSPGIRRRLTQVLGASEKELFGENETAPVGPSLKGGARE